MMVMNPKTNPNLAVSEDEEFIAKFKCCDSFRFKCTPQLLLAIGSLLFSSYEKVRINAIVALVNLSLGKPNKIKIIRSEIVSTVVQLLKGRLSETQEHATGLIFSLSLEEKNRTAIGVLGALSPLLNSLLRSKSERTKSDSALALYNLSLDHSNRVKLVKQLNVVTPLLTVLRWENEAIAGRTPESAKEEKSEEERSAKEKIRDRKKC